MKPKIKTHEDLEVYRLDFDTAMKIFDLSKKFPVEEKYSLTDCDWLREQFFSIKVPLQLIFR